MIKFIESWDMMKEGETYNDVSPFLVNARVETKKLINSYNKTSDNDISDRRNILEKLFNKCGDNVLIEPNFKCEYGRYISIGNNVYINFECIILDCAPVVIGNNALFGPRVGIYTADHSINPKERLEGGCVAKSVTIGNNVWLGGNVKIIGGVTIGDNSVIGVGSIVTRSIPANVVAVGNPCKVIKPI